LPDGTYNVKVVVSDEAGNQKEQATSVVVKNALVKIHRDLLVGGDASAYFITDSVGQVVGRANFLIDGTHDDVVSLYPSEALIDTKFNLSLVFRSANLNSRIEHCVANNRGAHVTKDVFGNVALNEHHERIPVRVKNNTKYDNL